ncbi:MAG: FoF1 ATP synthase subunit delta/epsilon [Thermodesulfovibrionales bacterium]
MNDRAFDITIVTLTGQTEKQITYLRLKDESGYFGIMKNHTDFLTVIEPSLGVYRGIDEKEIFIALDGGILAIKSGKVTINTREIFESEDPEKLSRIIDETIIRRNASELSFRNILSDIEDAFIKKTIELKRRFSP